MHLTVATPVLPHKSLPSRGAWIEINESAREAREQKRRSPRGERGLKFDGVYEVFAEIVVAPLAGSVD